MRKIIFGAIFLLMVSPVFAVSVPYYNFDTGKWDAATYSEPTSVNLSSTYNVAPIVSKEVNLTYYDIETNTIQTAYYSRPYATTFQYYIVNPIKAQPVYSTYYDPEVHKFITMVVS